MQIGRLYVVRTVLNYGKYFWFPTEIVMIIFIQVRVEIRTLIHFTRDPDSANSKIILSRYVEKCILRASTGLPFLSH